MIGDDGWIPGTDEDEDDEATVRRSDPSSRPPQHPGVDIVLDSGVVRSIRGHTLIGRDPTVEPGARLADLVRIDDDAMSLSKTHAALDLEDGCLVVSDLGSTNGTTVHSTRDGERQIGTGERVRLEVGDRVLIGDRWFDVGQTGPTMEVSAVPPPPVELRCANCGSALQPIDRFCIQCGAPANAQVADVPLGADHSRSMLAEVPLGPDHSRSKLAEVPLGPDGSRSKLALTTIGAIVVVAAVVGGALVFLRDGDDDALSAGSEALRIPDQAEPVWDVTIDGNAFVTGAPDALFVTATEGNDVEFSRFDGEGAEVWSSRGRGASSGYLIDVADGHLIAMLADEQFEYRMVALDPTSGDEVWSEDVDDDESGRILDGRLYVMSGGEVALVDAASGERLERVRGDSAILRGDFFLVRDDDEVEIFDRSLSSVADPIRIGDEAGIVVFDGSSLFVVEEGEITAYDSAGEERWRDDTSHDFIEALMPVSGGRILISGSDGVELMAVADGRLESAWDRDGSVEGLYAFGGRSLVTVFDEDDVLLVDLMTGDEIKSFDGATWSYAQGGSNAIVVYEADGDEVAVTAISPADGEELWDLSDEGSFTLLNDGIAHTSYDFDQDETEIEIYR